MKNSLRKIRLYRIADDFTNTHAGENVVFALVVICVILGIIWRTTK